MSYVFITRMFSGLYETIRDREWKPSGIPTFIRLVEKIALREMVTWFVVCRTKKESSIIENGFRCIVFKERINMFVIPYTHIINSGKVNAFLTTLSALYHIVITLKSINGRLFYFDRSNIVIAAIFKVISSSPVVIRALGLYPDQKELSTKILLKLMSFLTFMSYKIKYDLCVCTQDGSGVEYYVDKLLNRKTKRAVLLNGVVKNEGVGGDVRNARTDKRIIFLFVGSLTQTKGIPELIDTFNRVSERCSNYKLMIVGKGELFPRVSSFVNERRLNDNIHLAGSVSLEEIRSYYESADVYISLNKLGNLSNTVLEAMSAGNCIVMLGKDNNTHTDESTEKLVPDNVVIRINRQNIVNDLTENIIDLIENPEKIAVYSERMRAFVKEFLWSWDERINYEMELLERIAKGKTIESLIFQNIHNQRKDFA